MNDEDKIPPGFRLQRSLKGHRQAITRIAWSPNGDLIASPSFDYTIRLWNAHTKRLLRTCRYIAPVYSVAWSPGGQVLASGDTTIHLWSVLTGEILQTFTGHDRSVYCVAWSPDGNMLASGSEDRTLRLWNIQTGQLLQTFTGSAQTITSVGWSPDGHTLASSSGDTIRLWNAQTGHLLSLLTGHSSSVRDLAWSPNGHFLAFGSDDKTITVWDPQTQQQLRILEGHTAQVTTVSFSYDDRLLVSKSVDGTVRLWRTDTWEDIAVLEEPTLGHWLSGLAFHPNEPVLATLGQHDSVVRIWELAPRLGITPTASSIRYTNAKVVLMGDSGVGKTGLSFVLLGRPYTLSDSTHGRSVWTFEKRVVEHDDGHREVRETLLWDLAGQPGYRLIHQLHLSEVAVALVVFDARNEIDPFAGVEHWVRALSVAQRVQRTAAPIKKFLVAARVDRGGRSVSRERIEALVKKWSFDGYFETSSKEGHEIAQLTEAIKNAIEWDILPKVTSTDLFQRIKTFLMAEKEAKHVLARRDALYRMFLRSEETLSDNPDLQAMFETCIGLIESKGLTKRLGFGDYVLLRPELLDAYASALVNAARDEPDGLGSLSEERVIAGKFFIPKDERMTDEQVEQLLLIAMVKDLVRYEIALREDSNGGSYLVFPSQSTREKPDLLDPEGKAVIFYFEGPVLNIYTTLAVRLSHSGLFTREELWKNAVTYTTRQGGTYGLVLHNIEEGCAELALFFDKNAGEETRLHFEEYVKEHLRRWALPETIRRRRVFVCSKCETPLADMLIRKRRERNPQWMKCPICDAKVSIVDIEEHLTASSAPYIVEMDRTADDQRARATAASILQGKVAIGDFDVFLCYNDKDKTAVKKLGEQLKELGILPWLDEWEMRPGFPWQRLLEKQIGQVKSAAVFVGKSGIRPWQQLQIEAFLREFVKRGCPVIPVLLPAAPKMPPLPPFLAGMSWVDYHNDQGSLDRLIWGITGKKRI